MRPRFLQLFPTALLFMSLGSSCAKKDDSQVEPAPTASYKLDGKLITCRVVVYPLTPLYGNDEQLLVHPFTTPTPTSGDEYLDLSFVKKTTELSTSYKM